MFGFCRQYIYCTLGNIDSILFTVWPIRLPDLCGAQKEKGIYGKAMLRDLFHTGFDNCFKYRFAFSAWRASTSITNQQLRKSSNRRHETSHKITLDQETYFIANKVSTGYMTMVSTVLLRIPPPTGCWTARALEQSVESPAEVPPCWEHPVQMECCPLRYTSNH